MDAAPLPFGRGERAQQRENVGSTPREGGRRGARIVAEVLSLLGPSFGIERVVDGPTDAPGRKIVLARADAENARLVKRYHRGTAPERAPRHRGHGTRSPWRTSSARPGAGPAPPRAYPRSPARGRPPSARGGSGGRRWEVHGSRPWPTGSPGRPESAAPAGW